MHSFICIQNQEIPLHSTGLKQKCSPAPYKHPMGGRDAVGVALRLLSVSVEIRKHVKSTSEPRKNKKKKNPLKNNTRAVTGPLISQFTVYSQAVAEIV